MHPFKTLIGRLKLFVFSFVCVSVMAGTSWAAPIDAIEVVGNKRVEDDTVLSYLPIEVGGEYSASAGSMVIKRLYKTGLFHSVDVSWNGSTLAIQVVENPLVNKVAFEGNDIVDDDQLKQIVSLKSRSVYTPDKVQRDMNELLAYYHQNGRFLAKISPQVIERDQNRLDVVYKISEGDKTKIRRVYFIGNDRFNNDVLKTVVRTKEKRWWRFLTSADVYDPERLELDRELLRRHYIEAGYADFRVVSAVAELSRDKKDFYVTYTLSEGDSYNFGNVDIRLDDVEDEGLSKADLLEVLTMKEGDRYNGALVESNIDTLIDLFGAKGFAFLDVKPRFSQDEANRTIGITFDVVPGPRVYVNRIEIRGNTRTRENVLRRQMRFAEGDAFSTNKLKRSRDRLNYLNYFENINIQHQETSQPDRVNIVVDVEEKSTGEFNVGAGFSTYEGLLATANVRERNFLGKGQDILVSFSLSGKRKNFNLSFTEPWFLGQELSAGIDVFNDERDLQEESSYNVNRRGGGFRFGFPLGEYLKDTINLSFKETEVENVDAASSIFIRDEEGKRSAIILSNILAKDTRDSAIMPTHGHRYSVLTEYSGFGTDTSYAKVQLNASWHKELKKDWVVSLGATLGAIHDIDDLSVSDHYNTGSLLLRGFDFGGFGPRDGTTDDALGGRYIAGTNMEVSFPLGTAMKEAGVKGLFFVDSGILTEFDDSPIVEDSRTPRVSVGVGAYWQSPLGPLRFEFGLPVVSSEEDHARIFSFNFGTRF